jgi:hypothetical protein
MSRKEAFERQVEAQLRQMSVEIQRLLDQIDGADAEVGNEMMRAVEEICGCWTDAERERNRVRTAGEEGWEHLQARFEIALQKLKSALDAPVARLRQIGTTDVSSMANPS